MNIYLLSFLLFTLFYEYIYNKYVFNSLVFIFVLYTYYIIQELDNKINTEIEFYNKIFEEKIINKVSKILEQEILEKNRLNEDLITTMERNTILIYELKLKIDSFEK